MVVRQGQPPGFAAQPEEFRLAVESMKQALVRPEILVEEMRAPQRIAPFSFALSADVALPQADEEESDTGTGRLILLHDPDGNEAWHGTYRCVAYVRAAVDPEQAADGMLSGVAWSWLTEALREHHVQSTAMSGTVTIVTSESFGAMVGEQDSIQVEIRASWTPLLDERNPMSAHVEAWAELLGVAVGLAPVPEGVSALGPRRTPKA